MSEITTEIKDISPEEAIDLLSKNIQNRRVLRNQVVRLAAQMKAGDWEFDGTPIRIAKSGRLLDGQHRLHALIESETTQKFLIISGLEESTQAVMDTGVKRSLKDMLDMMGEKSATQIAALIAASYRYSHGARGASIFHSSAITVDTAAVSSPSIPVLLRYFEEHPELRDIIRPGDRAARSLTAPPSLMNFTYWVLRGIDDDDAEFFIERLTDGAGLPVGSPILALRNKMLDMYREARTRGHRPSYELGMALIFKAWNLYREGKEVQRLQFHPGGSRPEEFPEPH